MLENSRVDRAKATNTISSLTIIKYKVSFLASFLAIYRYN